MLSAYAGGARVRQTAAGETATMLRAPRDGPGCPRNSGSCPAPTEGRAHSLIHVGASRPAAMRTRRNEPLAKRGAPVRAGLTPS